MLHLKSLSSTLYFSYGMNEGLWGGTNFPSPHVWSRVGVEVTQSAQCVEDQWACLLYFAVSVTAVHEGADRQGKVVGWL